MIPERLDQIFKKQKLFNLLNALSKFTQHDEQIATTLPVYVEPASSQKTAAGRRSNPPPDNGLAHE